MKTTKDKLLDLGQCLIQQHGYFGFSYYQLAEQLGIKHAAIHYHFRRKEDLGKAIIQKNIKLAHTSFKKWDTLDDWQKIDAFISIYRSSNDTHRICMVGALGADFVNLTPQLKAGLQELINELWTWLAQVLEQGRANGSFHFQGDAHTKAIMLCTNMMAGLQFARILGQDKFEEVCQSLIQDLKPIKKT